jgi:chromosomal replication initiation ATPase DnaA
MSVSAPFAVIEMDKFRQKYREQCRYIDGGRCSIYWQSGEAVQEEFFHTINTFIRSKKAGGGRKRPYAERYFRT